MAQDASSSMKTYGPFCAKYVPAGCLRSCATNTVRSFSLGSGALTERRPSVLSQAARDSRMETPSLSIRPR